MFIPEKQFLEEPLALARGTQRTIQACSLALQIDHFYQCTDMVLTWVLNLPLSLRKPQASNFLCLPVTEKLNNPLRQTKYPYNSNMLLKSNSHSNTDFRTANKHVLIPSYVF